MIVAIHQPNFLPWLGYFHKLARADAFVVLDSVQYTRNSFINRNRIKTKSQVQWLTVPVSTRGRFQQPIHEVVTVSETDWRRKHLHTMEANYGRAPYFADVFTLLKSQYHGVDAQTNLAELNILLISTVCAYLGITPKIIRARDLAVQGASTDLLVNICRELKADCYLAGSGAKNYQQDQLFESAGIRVESQNFISVPYRQLWGSFAGNLSVIDALMNCGRATINLLGVSDSTRRVSIQTRI